MPIGPNFEHVYVDGANGDKTMFIAGRTDRSLPGTRFDIRWALAKDLDQSQKPVNGAAKSLLGVKASKTAHQVKPFDSNGSTSWTVAVKASKLPKVGDWLVVSGRMTTIGEAPESFFWAETLQVEAKPVPED
jgi:hypothetical protein